VPKKKQPAKKRALYNSPPPKLSDDVILHATPVVTAPFELREDGTIETGLTGLTGLKNPKEKNPVNSVNPVSTPRLAFSSDTPFVRLYHGNSLELLDAIYEKYGDAGRFDAIFADPPYFLSNGGISCHAGRMVKVDKGDWDKSRGPELNHEFNMEWLARCQRVLKPNGTIWVSGTHHVIFSIGYAMQQLGYKILNDIAWEKPNPPPNLSCRYFTHSTETILWAAKNEKSKHVFNYSEMRKVTGKQMKTVWRKEEFALATETPSHREGGEQNEKKKLCASEPLWQNPIWTLTAPGGDEKTHGKHPTQKPVALIERCLLASTNEGDLVLDPFLGGGTTAIAAIKLKRGCVGIELDEAHAKLAEKRLKDLIQRESRGGG
jgi:site-specific DNA-methyltransferase (adenine-specific)